MLFFNLNERVKLFKLVNSENDNGEVSDISLSLIIIIKKLLREKIISL